MTESIAAVKTVWAFSDWIEKMLYEHGIFGCYPESGGTEQDKIKLSFCYKSYGC